MFSGHMVLGILLKLPKWVYSCVQISVFQFFVDDAVYTVTLDGETEDNFGNDGRK